jgi:hypothetical protein
MSRLKVHEIIDWKGTTFNQVSAGIKYNNKINLASVGPSDIFRARPLRIYRKEVASSDFEHCSSNVSIDDFDKPGGTSISSVMNNRGLANTEIIIDPSISCDNPALCSAFLSAENNARRRVRSSGMIKPKFNANIQGDTYYTTSGQYLSTRNRAFAQNQYFHIRIGDNTSKPGSANAIQNVYSANGLSDCTKCEISATVFKYIWIDGNEYTVTVPAGFYNIHDLNQLLYSTMETNKHYYVESPMSTHIYLLALEYDVTINRILIRSTITNNLIHPEVTYMKPLGVGITWTLGIPASPDTANPSLIVPASLTTVLGFAQGTYPSSITGNLADVLITGTSAPDLQPKYAPIYYKPSNSQFGVQGAVSSGDLINRKKYDTVTSVGASFRSAYGSPTANALAYGSSMYGYTVKDKIGFPIKKTPTFSKSSGQMVECESTKI